MYLCCCFVIGLFVLFCDLLGVLRYLNFGCCLCLIVCIWLVCGRLLINLFVDSFVKFGLVYLSVVLFVSCLCWFVFCLKCFIWLMWFCLRDVVGLLFRCWLLCGLVGYVGWLDCLFCFVWIDYWSCCWLICVVYLFCCLFWIDCLPLGMVCLWLLYCFMLIVDYCFGWF